MASVFEVCTCKYASSMSASSAARFKHFSRSDVPCLKSAPIFTNHRLHQLRSSDKEQERQWS
eukprot:768507-Hanusia_phi.AAC.2